MKGFGDNKNLNSDKINPKRDKDLVLKNKLDFAKNLFNFRRCFTRLKNLFST